jgi:hypothetical protein
LRDPRRRSDVIRHLLVVVAALAASHHYYHPHDPGCRTKACDQRVDRWWAAHHPPPTNSPGSANEPGQSTEGSGSLPACTWEHEGGSSWTVYNTEGSGASGHYQIMPGTWKENGGQTANAAEASPEEQTRVAERLYAKEGGKPWVNC